MIAKEAFAACAAGDFKTLKEMVRINFNLEDCDAEGNSALHYAVRGKNMALIRFLTEQGGLDPSWANQHMETPMHLAKTLCPEAYAYFTERLGFSLEESYQNPVQRGMHPDPSIVRVGEDYYMVNSSFIMFPCIPISHSRDLVHWEVIGHAVTDAAWAREHLTAIQGGRGFWAPDISYHKGRFYICATLRLNDDADCIQMQMVTSAERAEGPYDTPVLHALRGIDPSLFADDDGKRYMLLNRGAQLVEISEDGKTLLTEPQLIWYGSNKHAPEGPHLLKKDGFYYCFLAEGGTGKGHMITVARAKNLYGPYEDCPYNPIMRQRHSAGVIQCAGHGKPVCTPDGRWFMVYLCSRFLEGTWGMLGRETCLDEITWTADGWPLVNMGKGPSTLAKLPYQGSAQQIKSVRASWYTPRVLEQKHLHCMGEHGMIEIAGCGEDLCSLACRSLLLWNQPEFDFDFGFDMYAPARGEAQSGTVSGAESVEVQSAYDGVQTALAEAKISKDAALAEALAGGDAGVVLYYDENTYVKFGRTKDEVFVAEYYDDAYVREVRCKLSESSAALSEEAVFSVETRGLLRRFYYNNVKIAEWRVTGICSEGLQKGKRFTSAMYGVYVNGEGVLCWRQHGDLQQD